ncbi:P-loop containing nucleoside triphosphate hydrolase protein [Thozetella sp. PMI_491]|nr:P-loop containing nucleoside triphosphate hydrolase protein [Thozetella sp. PMI_491]
MAAQPLHAGGAINHLRLLDPSVSGLSVVRTLLHRWSELDITHLGSIVALAGVAPAAWRLLRDAGREAWTWVKHFFIASVTIPAADPINRNVASWVLAHVIEPRRIRFFTAKTEVGRDVSDVPVLKKTRRSVQYCPHWETAWFWHDGNLFVASRAAESFRAAMTDPAYNGVGGEELTISCLGRTAAPLKRFIDECREFADKKTQYYVMVYSRDRYGLSWKPKACKPIRRIETVHFDNAVKQDLLFDMQKYLDPRTRRLYRSRSMPYRRGYLFYGPPGTGKSSLSTALGGEFGLDLYEVKIPSVTSDADLEQMFQEIPPQCIVLLEDIDAVWSDRDAPRNPDAHDPSGSMRPGCTLSGLLNVLDGVGSQEGRVVIMTTNKPEHLDSALVRPGRVDLKVFLGNISRKSAKEMFVRMFAPTSDDSEFSQHMDVEIVQKLATEFAASIPEDTLTPSQLQGFFQLHLESASEAAANIATWVEKELAKKSPDKDFEMVSQQGSTILRGRDAE